MKRENKKEKKYLACRLSATSAPSVTDMQISAKNYKLLSKKTLRGIVEYDSEI
jgi:hypothetical protein